MIIVKLLGGLGNQMFQYAAGYALAKHLDLPLKVDTTALQRNKMHGGFQFDKIFLGKVSIASKLDLIKCLGLSFRSIPTQGIEIKDYQKFSKSQHVYYQNTHNFMTNFFIQKNRRLYLSGYWQSSKYFKMYEKDIRAFFKFKNEFSGQNRDLSRAIRSNQSVSIHIRRGDYISNPKAQAFHGTCPDEYYEKAIANIKSKNPNALFFVFSDDPSYAASKFGSRKNFITVPFNDNEDAFRDMYLMSLCKTHVIANSTFSWWGAWLSDNHSKTVFAPKKWFSGSSEAIVDIYEDGWSTL